MNIGTRGQAALKPLSSYFKQFLSCLADSYEPKTNPSGYIALCVAENKQVQAQLETRLSQPDIASAGFLNNREVYYYNTFLGLQEAREGVAHFLTRKFLCPSNDNDSDKIDPNHVTFGSGCASLLHHLCYILAEEGDAVLIPAPYYAVFETDVSIIAKCVAFPITQKDPSRGPTVEELEAATQKAEEQGLTVKMLLLTNPNNPLGVIYKPEIIQDAIHWARNKSKQGPKIHTIVDEIYALSVHNPQNDRFESVLRTLNNNLGDDVHFVWALSKDFGSSGFRVGIVCTQNDNFLRAYDTLNQFSSVSFPMQCMISKFLTDDDFVDSFLEHSSQCLFQAYTLCINKLDEMSIPYIPAQAGMFVYCDFSSLLPENTFEGEAQFMNLLADVFHVVMTPGESQRDANPGMFRICYAWNSMEVLKVALDRIKFVRDQIVENGWSYTASLSIEDCFLNTT